MDTSALIDYLILFVVRLFKQLVLDIACSDFLQMVNFGQTWEIVSNFDVETALVVHREAFSILIVDIGSIRGVEQCALGDNVVKTHFYWILVDGNFGGVPNFVYILRGLFEFIFEAYFSERT